MTDVYVAGSINMDVVATARRIPQAGETVPGTDVGFYPGGKGANQAVAAAKSGAPTQMMGRVGDDAFAGELREFLGGCGVGLDFVASVSGPTGTALIVVDDSGENSIVVVPGANASLFPRDVEALPVKRGDILVSQFEIPLETVAVFFEVGRRAGSITVLNPAPALDCPADLLALADIIILNETELAYFAKASVTGETSESDIVDVARQLRSSLNQIVVVTLGARGAVSLAGDRTIITKGHSVNAADTTGAGDCFVGTLAASLSNGTAIDAALKVANAAASLCVQTAGAGPSMPDADAVAAIL